MTFLSLIFLADMLYLFFVYLEFDLDELPFISVEPPAYKCSLTALFKALELVTIYPVDRVPLRTEILLGLESLPWLPPITPRYCTTVPATVRLPMTLLPGGRSQDSGALRVLII